MSSSYGKSTGVWAPGSTQNNSSSLPSLKQDGDKVGSDQVDSSRVPLPALEEPPPAVWTPPNAPSPASQRKFRPVNFNVPSSPTSSSPRTISLVCSTHTYFTFASMGKSL